MESLKNAKYLFFAINIKTNSIILYPNTNEFFGSFFNLLAEDGLDDIELFEGALKDNGTSFLINILYEGDKVLAYLHDFKGIAEFNCAGF